MTTGLLEPPDEVRHVLAGPVMRKPFNLDHLLSTVTEAARGL
jgi:hypothetical protein